MTRYALRVCVPARWILAVVAVLAAPGVGWADDGAPPVDAADQAEESNMRGREFYGHGEYDNAVAAFRAAFDTSHDPRYLLNLARAYRAMGRYPTALVYYGWYLEWSADPAKHEKVTREAAEIAECNVDAVALEKQHEPRIMVAAPTRYRDRVEFRVTLTAQGVMTFHYEGWWSRQLDALGVQTSLVWDGERTSAASGETLHGTLVVNDPDVDLSAFDLRITGHVDSMLVAGTQNVLTTTWGGRRPWDDPRYKQTVWSVRGVFGSVAVDDGPNTASAPMGGLALRVHTPLQLHWAVELELGGYRSGDLEMTGGATRSATLGQVLGYAVFRTGLTSELALRVGAGMQLADFSSDDPALAGLEWDILFSGGVGYTRRLGNWSLGVDATLSGAFATETLSMSLGVRAGWGH